MRDACLVSKKAPYECWAGVLHAPAAFCSLQETLAASRLETERREVKLSEKERGKKDFASNVQAPGQRVQME